MGKLITAQSNLFDQMTSRDSQECICSPGLESGTMHSISQDGEKVKFGQDQSPASPSVPPGKAKRSTTKGIFGQTSFDSSKHDDLSFALASKLRPLTDSLGSTLFNLTWTVRVTPAGRSISALRASEPLTEGSVFIGWPTPRSVEAGHSTGNPDRAMDCKSRLEDVVFLSAWGTPAARDWKSGAASQETLDKNARPLSEQAVLAGWKTPCVPNGGRISGNPTDIGKHQDGTKAQIGLENEAKLSGWKSPKATDGMGRYSQINGKRYWGFWMEAEASAWPVDPSTDSGGTPIGYLLGHNGWEIVPACGQLNASHSRWLMGLPAIWCEAAIAAFRSLKERKRGLRGSEGTETG